MAILRLSLKNFDAFVMFGGKAPVVAALAVGAGIAKKPRGLRGYPQEAMARRLWGGRGSPVASKASRKVWYSQAARPGQKALASSKEAPLAKGPR